VASRQIAAGKSEVAAKMVQTQHRIEGAIALGQAIQASAQAGASALNATIVQQRLATLKAEVEHAHETHAASLQGNLYVRPAYAPDRGWSLAVVETATGDRADLLLSPDDALSRFAPNLPVFAVDASDRRIVSKGLGFDAARLERYNKATVDGWWDVPFPSLLAFDLRFLGFARRPANGTQTAPVTARSPRQVERELLAAAARGDAAGVTRALDAGADPNAGDEYGATPLMLAAESVRPYQADEPIRVLLDRGAAVSLKDAGGLTAIDHFALLSQRLASSAERAAFDALNGAMREEYLNGKKAHAPRATEVP
jgi:hypothetical protein